MTFLIVCGGSAGHINPAIAIAAELKRTLPETKILFVGADKTMEKKLVPEAGFDLINIKMSGLRRGFSPRDIIHNVKTAKNLLIAGKKAASILKEYKPDAVIGTGGYICYPVLKKASRMGFKTYVLEPNAYPGLAVKLLSGFVDKVFVTYTGLENRYKRPGRIVYTGTPLRNEFYEAGSLAESSVNKERPLVISYWGSLGADKMNEVILDFISLNITTQKFDHIHAAGVSGSVEEMKKRLVLPEEVEPTTVHIDIREYISDMITVMKKADLVLSRAGASTIAELTVLGKPAILIPSPNVTENHQEENAKQLQNAGGALMIKESECTGETLFNTVINLLDDKEKLEVMSKAQKSLAPPNAAKKIVDIVLSH